MDEIQPPESTDPSDEELLFFCALGDLHYYTAEQWRIYHAQRLSPMFRDLRGLWSSQERLRTTSWRGRNWLRNLG